MASQVEHVLPLDEPVTPLVVNNPNVTEEPDPKPLEEVKKMFDSATILRMEQENPFKGSNDLNRTNQNRFIGRKSSTILA